MSEGLCCRHVAHLLHREGAEGTARSRYDEFLDGILAFALQTLEDSGVFRIDGQDSNLIFGHQAFDESAGHYQRLLVGQCDGLACPDGSHRGTQSREAHHRRYDDVDGVGLHHLGQGIGACPHLDRKVGERFFHFIVVSLVCDDHSLGSEFPGLFYQQIRTSVCCNCIDAEQVGMFLHHFECLLTDTSGRA